MGTTEFFPRKREYECMKRYRIERLQKVMSEKDVGLVILWPSANWVYLVSYAPIAVERPTFLFVSPDNICSVVPEMDYAEFKEKTELEHVFSWADAQGPREAVRRAWELIAGRQTEEAAKIALDDTMPFQYLKALETHISELPTQLASDVMMELRLIKDPQEIESIRKTSQLIERVLNRSDAVFRAGMTEKQVAAKLKTFLLEEGADTLDYVIVQAAPNSASAHHMPGLTTIREGEPVLLDIAVSRDGYYSDITRQVCLGGPSEKYQEVYRIVRQAQAAAVDVVKPGNPLSAIDKAARDIITAAGMGKYFYTRTGHGLGLEVHEPPSIWSENDLPLKTGLVFTIEPGIYLQSEFGVRIEDTIAVTDQGADRLTASSRELRVL